MYQLTTIGSVLRISDGAYVPDDDDNIDWIAYMKWLDAGGVPLPPEVQQTPPNT